MRVFLCIQEYQGAVAGLVVWLGEITTREILEAIHGKFGSLIFHLTRSAKMC